MKPSVPQVDYRLSPGCVLMLQDWPLPKLPRLPAFAVLHQIAADKYVLLERVSFNPVIPNLYICSTMLTEYILLYGMSRLSLYRNRSVIIWTGTGLCYLTPRGDSVCRWCRCLHWQEAVIVTSCWRIQPNEHSERQNIIILSRKHLCFLLAYRIAVFYPNSIW
jgi:hypothetical protein